MDVFNWLSRFRRSGSSPSIRVSGTDLVIECGKCPVVGRGIGDRCIDCIVIALSREPSAGSITLSLTNDLRLQSRHLWPLRRIADIEAARGDFSSRPTAHDRCSRCPIRPGAIFGQDIDIFEPRTFQSTMRMIQDAKSQETVCDDCKDISIERIGYLQDAIILLRKDIEASEGYHA